jgi:hypothetical protein
MRRCLPNAFAITLLVFFLVFFYWGFLVGRCFIWDDTLTEFYPAANYFAKSIRLGRFPLWFPGGHDGSPFYSNPHMAVFYPLQWFLIPFVQNGRLPFLVYQHYIFLHYLFGGLFMYAFLRQLKLGPIAALNGAVVFCFSGFASLRIVNFVLFQVYVWLPLQLCCVHRFTSTASRWAWLALVAAMAMSLFAGDPQITVYCWYLVVAYWSYRAYRGCRREDRGWHAALRQFGLVEVPKIVGTFVLIFGIGAVMLIPTAQNWLYTERPSHSFLTTADTSLPYHGLLTLLVPNFFGSMRMAGSPVAFWGFDPHNVTVAQTFAVNASVGFWQYWEFGAYAGQIFWLAILLILFNWKHVDNRKVVGFFLAAWLAATWFMLGRYGGLFDVLYYLLPSARMFRAPVKMGCVATFAAAILAAYGVDLLSRRERKLRFGVVLFAVVGYVGLVSALSFVRMGHFSTALENSSRLAWSRQEACYALGLFLACACAAFIARRVRGRSMQVMSLCAIAVISVADFYHGYGSFQCGDCSPDEYYPENNRLLTLLEDYREQRGPFRFGQIIRGQIGEELATFRNLSYFHDFLEVPECYVGFSLNNIGKFQGITNEAAKVAIQNVKVVIEKDEQGKEWLGTRPDALPRARFFTKIRFYDSRTALLVALERGEIDWRKETAVGEPLPADLFRGDGRSHVTGTNDEVQFIGRTPEEYSILYNVSQPGIVFVSETFYPGWTANNGHLKLIEVFGAFQGLVIPEGGRGQITVRFSPPILKLGLSITILSAVAVCCLVIFGKWSKLQPLTHT